MTSSGSLRCTTPSFLSSENVPSCHVILVIVPLPWDYIQRGADHSTEKDWQPEDILERVFDMAHVDMMQLSYYICLRSDCEIESTLKNGAEIKEFAFRPDPMRLRAYQLPSWLTVELVDEEKDSLRDHLHSRAGTGTGKGSNQVSCCIKRPVYLGIVQTRGHSRFRAMQNGEPQKG